MPVIGMTLAVLAAHLACHAKASFVEAPRGDAGIEVLDLEEEDPRLVGFGGGFQDGTWGYVLPAPARYAWDLAGPAARFSLQNFSNVQKLELSATAPTNYSLRGFVGGFHDGTWGYTVATYKPHGTRADAISKVVRFRLQDFKRFEVLNLNFTVSSLFQDDSWGYVTRVLYSGQLTRFSLQDFSTLQLLDLRAIDPRLSRVVGGFQDGTWGYVFGYDKIARFSLQDFKTVKVLTVEEGRMNFIGGFRDGASGYVLSDYNEVARFSLQNFTDVEVLKLVNPNNPRYLSSRETCGGFRHGSWGYVLPGLRGVGGVGGVGAVARFSLQDFETVEELQVEAADSDVMSYSFAGGFHDGTWGYGFGKVQRGGFHSGKVVRFSLEKAWAAPKTTATPTTTATGTTQQSSGAEGVGVNYAVVAPVVVGGLLAMAGVGV